jgi:hypothetical protein
VIVALALGGAGVVAVEMWVRTAAHLAARRSRAAAGMP